MITKLRCKFVIIITVIVISVMFVAFYSNYAVMETTMYQQSISTLENTLQTGKTSDRKTFIIKKDILGIQQQKGSERGDINELVDIALKSDNSTGEIKDKHLRYMKKQANGVTFIAFTDTYEETTTLNNMIRFATITIACCSIVFFGISVFLAYYTTRPVYNSIKRQKQLIADASHELKTPITAILASSDILLSDLSLNDDKRTWVNGIKSSAKDMSFLISDMLSLANSDDNKQKPTFETLDLSDLVTSVCLNYEAVFFESGKAFTYDTEEKIFVNGNANSLKQLVKIFLDNARKHSDDGGTIDLSLKSAQDKAIMSVFNSGTPIPHNEIHKVFERFYRVDKARNTTTGSGLGLSIAKRIAEAHSTKIGVSSDTNGTCFSICFKTVKQKQK